MRGTILNVSIEVNDSRLGLAFIAIFFLFTAIEQVSMHSFVDLPRYGSAKPVFGRALSTSGKIGVKFARSRSRAGWESSLKVYS